MGMWNIFKRKKSVEKKDEKPVEAKLFGAGDEENDDGKIALKPIDSGKTHATLDTIAAITDPQEKRRVVTRRIRRSKRLIRFLIFFAFVRLLYDIQYEHNIMSAPFPYILYEMVINKETTIGFGFIGRYVRGTAVLEVVVSVGLFIVSLMRVICPKNENLYYFVQISYIFAVSQYAALIPLNIRNFEKLITDLEFYMRREADIGRCVKVETIAAVPSKTRPLSFIKDSHGCSLYQKEINLPHIRPVIQMECDGYDSWYEKATKFSDEELEKQSLANMTKLTNYEVNSELWTRTQRKNKCCGIRKNTDWMKYPKQVEDVASSQRSLLDLGLEFQTDLFVYPRSCCPDNVTICFANVTYGETCFNFAKLTILTYSIGLLVTLFGCAVINLFIFILLTRYRRMVEKFRPDLLKL